LEAKLRFVATTDVNAGGRARARGGLFEQVEVDSIVSQQLCLLVRVRLLRGHQDVTRRREAVVLVQVLPGGESSRACLPVVIVLWREHSELQEGDDDPERGEVLSSSSRLQLRDQRTLRQRSQILSRWSK
jgi:hypothetical protein